jgi:hypothetical protein
MVFFTSTEVVHDIVVNKTATKQAIYRSIKSLKKREVITQYKKQLLLNPLWVKSFEEFVQKMRFQTERPYTDFQSMLTGIEHKKRASYVFSSYAQADVFWSHVANCLVHSVDSKKPMCLYNPHQMFLVARRENEIAYLDNIAKTIPVVLIAIGYTSQLDYNLARVLINKKIKYAVTGDKITKDDSYVNIFGDYVLTAKFTKGMNDYIHNWFTSHPNPSIKEEQAFTDYVNKNCTKLKIIIQEDSKKAEQWRKRIMKHFVV